MFEIDFSETAERQLYKLEKQVQIRIVSTLERIKLLIFVIEVGHRKNIYD